MKNRFQLLRSRKFWPLMATLFCGCLNDCILKNALIMLVLYKLASQDADMLVVLINAIFMLPFIVFAGVAGQVSDKYEKARVIQVIKFAEIFIIIMGIAGFYYSSFPVLITSVALMGVHSTFFGTIKLSIVPDQLEKKDFLLANGYIEFGTFIGVLLGTFLGGLYNWNKTLVISIMLCVAIIGFISSLFITKSNNKDPQIRINTNILNECYRIVRYSYAKTGVFLVILGISWFWFLGSCILTQIPIWTKETIGGSEALVNLFIASFSLGVCVGSLACNKLLKNQISTKYMVATSVLISVVCINLFLITINVHPRQDESLIGVIEFLSAARGWYILANLIVLAGCSGIYVVPLYAMLQSLSSSRVRSKAIAANNLVNSIFIVLSTILNSSLLYVGCSPSSIMLTVGLLNLIAAGYIYSFIPSKNSPLYTLLSLIAKVVLKLLYRVEVRGIENFYAAGKRMVIVSNHVSYLDALLITLYMPEKPVFAIHSSVAEYWWVKIFLKLGKAFPIDNNNPLALNSLVREVEKGQKVAIFPEGRISPNGTLMKTYAGPIVIAQKSKAVILPIIVEGAELTPFATLNHSSHKRLFGKVIVHLLPPIDPAEKLHSLPATGRLNHMANLMYDIMVQSLAHSKYKGHNFIEHLLKVSRTANLAGALLQDASISIKNYNELFREVLLVRNALISVYPRVNSIGLLSSNSISFYVALLALQSLGIRPLIIDESVEPSTILENCASSKIQLIITQRESPVASQIQAVARDVGQQIELDYLDRMLKKSATNPLSIAVKFVPGVRKYLFEKLARQAESGMNFLHESGQVVSYDYSSMITSMNQFCASLAMGRLDSLLNSETSLTPMSIYVTLMGLAQGMGITFLPRNLVSKNVPEYIYMMVSANVVFATNYALADWAHYAHCFDFFNMRYVFSYGGKLDAEVKRRWLGDFGVRILEICTDLSPEIVVSVNTPIQYKHGTLGKVLPHAANRILLSGDGEKEKIEVSPDDEGYLRWLS